MLQPFMKRLTWIQTCCFHSSKGRSTVTQYINPPRIPGVALWLRLAVLTLSQQASPTSLSDFLHFPELLQTTCWGQVVFSAARTGGESSENNRDNNGIPEVESIVPGTVLLNISIYAKVYFHSTTFWREMLFFLLLYLYQTALSYPCLRLLAQGYISCY